MPTTPHDAWGISWGHSAPGTLDGHWLTTWTFAPSEQPLTSSGAGGHTGRGARRGRFFDFPNIIDDGNLIRPPAPPKRRAPKREPEPVEEEDDPVIAAMRNAIAVQRALSGAPTTLADIGRASLQSLRDTERAELYVNPTLERPKPL